MTNERRSAPLPWLFGVTVLAFWPTLLALPPHWLAFSEYGFVIAALVSWLMWRDRHRLGIDAGEPARELFPMLAIVSLVWMVARVMDIGTIHQTLFYCLIFGWVIAVFGRPAFKVAAPIAATALIAAPFWDAGVPALQRVAVIVTGLITRLGGVEAEIGAYTIAISTGTFEVEAGCSGLGYLMVSMTLGAVYAHLFVRGWRTQAKVILVAVASALLTNWIRISALVFVGEATAMQSSLIADHVLFGWIVFTVMLVPAYLAIRWVERRDGAAISQVAPKSRDHSLSHHPGVARLSAARLATGMTIVGPLIYMAVSILPRSTEIDGSPEVFGFASTVDVRATDLPQWTPDFLGIDERADWLAVPPEPSGVTVTASRFWYVQQHPGEELIQGHNRIAPDSLTAATQFVVVSPSASRIVLETVLFEEGSPRIVWSWYRVGGQETPFGRNAKLLEVWAWLTRSGPSELVTLSAACDPENCEAAVGALRASIQSAGGG